MGVILENREFLYDSAQDETHVLFCNSQNITGLDAGLNRLRIDFEYEYRVVSDIVRDEFVLGEWRREDIGGCEYALIYGNDIVIGAQEYGGRTMFTQGLIEELCYTLEEFILSLEDNAVIASARPLTHFNASKDVLAYVSKVIKQKRPDVTWKVYR